jgi:hypothetical protein
MTKEQRLSFFKGETVHLDVILNFDFHGIRIPYDLRWRLDKGEGLATLVRE